jgi:hypothetical protein
LTNFVLYLHLHKRPKYDSIPISLIEPDKIFLLCLFLYPINKTGQIKNFYVLIYFSFLVCLLVISQVSDWINYGLFPYENLEG